MNTNIIKYTIGLSLGIFTLVSAQRSDLNYAAKKYDQYAYSDAIQLYEDITKPGGSIDWLKQKDSYYKFNEAEIKRVIDFELYQDNAHLTVEVFEDLELITPSGVDPTKSGQKTHIRVYDLKKNQSGQWRIYDHRKKQ